MAIIIHPQEIDNREVARKIKNWFNQKSFETKVIQGNNSYAIKARRKSKLRSFVGADRAIEVGIRTTDGETQVEVRQGSWQTNAISNAAWFVVTGGMNLAISGWSIVIQKDLENHIKKVLDDIGGFQEIEL